MYEDIIKQYNIKQYIVCLHPVMDNGQHVAQQSQRQHV